MIQHRANCQPTCPSQPQQPLQHHPTFQPPNARLHRLRQRVRRRAARLTCTVARRVDEQVASGVACVCVRPCKSISCNRVHTQHCDCFEAFHHAHNVVQLSTELVCQPYRTRTAPRTSPVALEGPRLTRAALLARRVCLALPARGRRSGWVNDS